MKVMAGYLVIALVLAGAGALCFGVSNADRQVASGHELLLTMQYDAAAVEPQGAIRPVVNLPGVGTDLTSEALSSRQTAEYWLARYDTLRTARDGRGAAAEPDPTTLFVAANAAYRVVQSEREDRAVALQHLEQVVSNYRDVLKAAPGDADAAFNYEFVVRTRNDLSRQRGSAPFVRVGIAEPAQTIHGRPGAPPKGVVMSQFKVMIPKRGDERQENQDAGKGDQKRRKG